MLNSNKKYDNNINVYLDRPRVRALFCKNKNNVSWSYLNYQIENELLKFLRK